jgi:CheY-like chemotaxis protein
VDEHGGTIGIETEEHKGSTFWFEIPLPRDEWAAQPDSAGLDAWRVLVVAGAGIPPAVTADLAACGFRLERAATLAETRARVGEAPPDALLLDPILPGARDLRADLHRDPRTAWLPVVQRPADLAQLRGSLQRAVRPPGEPRVLLVDTDSCARQVLTEMLRTEGLEPIPAIDGASALEIARRLPPDLIILDAELPGMSGQALVQELRRSRLCATPLLVYTERDLPAEDHRLLRLGPTSFLVKTRATERELLGTILELLGDIGTVR